MKRSFPLIAAIILLPALSVAESPNNPDPKSPATKVETRLKFQAYDGDPQVKGEVMTFQINTVDIRQPTEFIKIGDTIKGTPFKLIKFVFKEVKDPQLNDLVDPSELTILNTKTNQTTVLVLSKVTTPH